MQSFVRSSRTQLSLILGGVAVAACGLTDPGKVTDHFDDVEIPGHWTAMGMSWTHFPTGENSESLGPRLMGGIPEGPNALEIEFRTDGTFVGTIDILDPAINHYGARDTCSPLALCEALRKGFEDAWGGPAPFARAVSGTWSIRDDNLFLGGSTVKFLNEVVFSSTFITWGNDSHAVQCLLGGTIRTTETYQVGLFMLSKNGLPPCH